VSSRAHGAVHGPPSSGIYTSILWGSRGIRFRGAISGRQLLLGCMEVAFWNAAPARVEDNPKCHAPTCHQHNLLEKRCRHSQCQLVHSASPSNRHLLASTPHQSALQMKVGFSSRNTSHQPQRSCRSWLYTVQLLLKGLAVWQSLSSATPEATSEGARTPPAGTSTRLWCCLLASHALTSRRGDSQSAFCPRSRISQSLRSRVVVQAG
jgi:hypothetical protein